MSARIEDILSHLSLTLEDCSEDASWNGLQVANKGIIHQIIGAGIKAGADIYLSKGAIHGPAFLESVRKMIGDKNL